MEKRLVPNLRTTRANLTGHFWFTKIPAGCYYLVTLIEEGAGPRQEERLGRASLAIYRIRRRRKTHQSRGHRLQNQSVLNLFKQLRLFFTLSRFIYISNSVSLKLVATQTPNLPKNHFYYLRKIIWT